MRKRKGDGVTSGTDAPESVAVILPLVVAPERDDRHYPAGAVVLAGYVTFTGVM
ncbi:hypothetical protein JFY04_16575 [Escherichia coli]|uniref:hypothetical protein n=1 Tax=Escherichia coli TaxID=562 RepID=UPI00187D17F2|nr:hypothetical protein [Escherichia coli]MBJ1966110.1 hypothetical protein [Escherichia coli]